MTTVSDKKTENSLDSDYQPPIGEVNGEIVNLTPEQARAYAIERDAVEESEDEGLHPDHPLYEDYMERLTEIDEAAIPEVEPPKPD